MAHTPDAPAPERRKEEPDAAQEADIPTDDGAPQDDMSIERDDLPPKATPQ